MKKICLVLGGTGFIGGHLVNFLKEKGNFVWAVDKHSDLYLESKADKVIVCDLRNSKNVMDIISAYEWDEVYMLAADMGGAEYCFTGKNDADIIRNNILMNTFVADMATKFGAKKVFFSSSACIYPYELQKKLGAPPLKESDAWYSAPDSVYGKEKLMAEELYDSFRRNYGLSVRICRFFNVFGPYGTYKGGREKAPAALCRKIAMAKDGDTIKIIGDGKQERSFLYITECLEGIRRIMESNYQRPINLGSEEVVSINQLAKIIMEIAEKNLEIEHDLLGPTGVRSRTPNNDLIKEKLGWAPDYPLKRGLKKTYAWIERAVKND